MINARVCVEEKGQKYRRKVKTAPFWGWFEIVYKGHSECTYAKNRQIFYQSTDPVRANTLFYSTHLPTPVRVYKLSFKMLWGLTFSEVIAEICSFCAILSAFLPQLALWGSLFVEHGIVLTLWPLPSHLPCTPVFTFDLTHLPTLKSYVLSGRPLVRLIPVWPDLGLKNHYRHSFIFKWVWSTRWAWQNFNQSSWLHKRSTANFRPILHNDWSIRLGQNRPDQSSQTIGGRI